jgi:hypothetical protein
MGNPDYHVAAPPTEVRRLDRGQGALRENQTTYWYLPQQCQTLLAVELLEFP